MNHDDVIIASLQKEGKPLKSSEIAEITSTDKKEIEKSIKKLVAEGKIYSPKRCFYDLK